MWMFYLWNYRVEVAACSVEYLETKKEETYTNFYGDWTNAIPHQWFISSASPEFVISYFAGFFL